MPQPKADPEYSDAALSEMIRKRRALAEAVANGDPVPKPDQSIKPRQVARKDTDLSQQQTPEADTDTSSEDEF